LLNFTRLAFSPTQEIAAFTSKMALADLVDYAFQDFSILLHFRQDRGREGPRIAWPNRLLDDNQG
jgi:hypothetical protein